MHVNNTLMSAAPEILVHQKYDNSADVYAYVPVDRSNTKLTSASFGVILWEIVTRKDFMGSVQMMHEIANRVVAGEREPIPASCLPPIAELISACWHQSTSFRPPFSQVVHILQHTFVEDYLDYLDMDDAQRVDLSCPFQPFGCKIEVLPHVKTSLLIVP